MLKQTKHLGTHIFEIVVAVCPGMTSAHEVNRGLIVPDARLMSLISKEIHLDDELVPAMPLREIVTIYSLYSQRFSCKTEVFPLPFVHSLRQRLTCVNV